MEQNKANQESQTLSDIIRGMQHAVNTAQDALQDYQFEQMAKYFDSDGKPLFVHVEVEKGRFINIPLITLIPQNTLTIKSLEMEFAVKIASASVKSFVNDSNLVKSENGNVESDVSKRSSFNVFFSSFKKNKNTESYSKDDVHSDDDVVRIKINFESTEETEAASRIREMLYKQIV